MIIIRHKNNIQLEESKKKNTIDGERFNDGREHNTTTSELTSS